MKDRKKVSDVKVDLMVEVSCAEGRVQGKIIEVLSTVDNNRGIKVKLDNGIKGRVQSFLSENEVDTNKRILPVEENPVIKEVKEEMVITIEDSVIEYNKGKLFSKEDNRLFEVTTRFFRPAYIKPIKNDIFGIVLFKVKGYDLNMAMYKINLYLQKFCITKDIKYKIIKTEEKGV